MVPAITGDTMTKLYRDDTGQVVQSVNPNRAKIQDVSVSGTSAATTNGSPHGCTLAMLISTTNCWFDFGTSPTATAAAPSIYLPAGVYFYLPVVEGTKVAFIQDSASGTAQVIPAL